LSFSSSRSLTVMVKSGKARNEQMFLRIGRKRIYGWRTCGIEIGNVT
jgi:hypothetical protein